MKLRPVLTVAAGWLALFGLAASCPDGLPPVALGGALMAFPAVLGWRWLLRRRVRRIAARVDEAEARLLAGPLSPWAAARVDQVLARQRAEAGRTAPDYADFVTLMRGAGAGDLEDVAAPDDDQPGGPL